jgi:hypothetical protein
MTDTPAIYQDKLIPVESTSILSVGEFNDYLVVRFKSGAVYRYAGMGEAFIPLLEAQSVGKYFYRHIRHLDYEKLCSRGCWAPAADKRGMCRECLDKLDEQSW